MFVLKLKSQMTLVMAAVVLSLIGADQLWSYWQGTQWMVRSTLREATSIEFDLARLDQAIEDLTPTLQENRKSAAQLEVEIEVLEEDTQEIVDVQKLAKTEMQHLRDGLAVTSGSRVRIDGRNFARAEVEDDLSRRLSEYQQTERHLQARQSLLEKQRQTFTKVVATVRENAQQQIALAQTAEALNGELKLLEMSNATNSIALKRPALGQARELAKSVETRIRTLQKLSEQDLPKQAIPVNLDRRTVTERFDAVFAKSGK